MSEQINSPLYVTCRCQHCDKGIEFDANDFNEGETRAVQCPHCNLETLIFAPKSPPAEKPSKLQAKINPRNRKSLIWIIIILVICIPWVWLAVVNFRIGYNLTQASQTWEHSNTIRDGDISITIQDLSIGPVAINQGEGIGIALTEPVLQIKVLVSNLSQTKKVDFDTWRAKRGLNTAVTDARLTDDNGNLYKNYFYDSPAGPIPSPYATEAAIYPGKSFQDVVTFEIPVQNRKWLHLELPTANYGGYGTLRFEITNSTIPKI